MTLDNYIFIMYLSIFFFFKQKTAYEMRISDWSSDVCSSDLHAIGLGDPAGHEIVDQHADVGLGAVDHESGGLPLAAWSTGSQGRVDPGNQPLGSGLFIARGPVNLAGEEQARQALGLQRGPELTRIDVVVLDGVARSEEHTSELQSLMRITYAVFC